MSNLGRSFHTSISAGYEAMRMKTLCLAFLREIGGLATWKRFAKTAGISI
jgi:hypothetical protein